MKSKQAIRMGTVLLLAGALYGCNSQDAQHLTNDAAAITKDTTQALGSATLAGKVNSVLSLRKGVDMSGLHIDAQGGIITLSGHVRNSEEKQRVINTVDGIRGVDKVVSKDLRVQP